MNRARLLGPMIGSFALALGCAGVKQNATRPARRARATRPASAASAAACPPPMPCQGMCTDFPSTPITDGTRPGERRRPSSAPPASGVGRWSLPDRAAGQHAVPQQLAAPALPVHGRRGPLRDPAARRQPGQRPRRLHDQHDLDDGQADLAGAVAVHTRDMPIEVTVRSAPPGGGQVQLGSQVHFTIAPVGANGKLVYWSTSGTTYFNGQPTGTETVLNGFAVGDESVREVLRPYMGATSQVAMTTYDQGLNTRPVKCIGCHTSTPDGAYIAFNDFYPWGAVLASGTAPAGAAPPTSILGLGGSNAITQPWVGITSFSQAHWTTGDHIMVAPLGTCGLAAVQPRLGHRHGSAVGPGLVRSREHGRRRHQHGLGQPARARPGTGSTRPCRAFTRRRRRGATTARRCCSR